MKAIPVILISGLLACLGLQPAWASADTAPALSSFSVTGSPATPGSTVALSYSVIVAAGSLKAMIFEYEDALGGTHDISADGDVPLTGTINQIIPASWPNGTYALRFITAVDPADNTARYMANGTIHNLPLASGPTSHTFNLNTADFTVTGSLADTIEPVLSSFSVAGMPAPGGSIGMSYSVTEAAGSLQAMIFEYEDALGGTHEIRTDGNVPLTGTIIQIIPASWPNGPYALSVITAVDPTGNEASYMADGMISNWPPGATGRTSHTFDLSTADFTVAPVPLPDAPTDVSVVAGDGQVTVSWRAPAPGFGPPITSYGVFALPITMSLPSRNASSIGDRPTATVTGLTNGVSYTIWVLASNGYGASPHSAPVTVTLMGRPPNLPYPPNPPNLNLSEAHRYVTAVYSDLFHRVPDPAGLATWTETLNWGTPRVAVANSITYSTEYRSTLIAGSYSHYLSRTPDPAGLKGWLGAMNAGWTISKMESGFIASPEYYGRAGSTDAGWVKNLYADVLGRGASPKEETSWTAQLRAGKSRSKVAMGFLLSTERLSTVVDGHYRHLLGRGIDPSGLRTWVGILQRGGRDEAIIGGIIASAEYYQRI